MVDESNGTTPVTVTSEGRTRQLRLTVIIAALITLGLWFFVKYGGNETDAANPTVYKFYVGGLVVLAINYINGNVLLQLVKRIPLPSKLLGKG